MIMMKEAQFYTNIDENIVQCGLCASRCVINEGTRGFCNVRLNKEGKLYSLVHGKLCSVALDPIEKKPLYMFASGSKTLSISTVGCNFRCAFCCNWHISQEWDDIFGDEYEPQQLIALAKQSNVQGFAYTYTEPTIFYEFAYDMAKMAHEHGFYNMFVSNGYITTEAIQAISSYLDAVVVDVKGSLNLEFYKKIIQIPTVEPILEALLSYKKNNIYLEITDLIVPQVGDKIEDIIKVCKWIVENLGPDTPFHVLQFFPTYKLLDLPRTPVNTLETAYEVAKREGLKYVYVGNVHGHELENTYCSNCKKLLIVRTISGVKQLYLHEDMLCPNCQEKIPIFGTKWMSCS
jgi:pyruvate formate lyase activating enzyme